MENSSEISYFSTSESYGDIVVLTTISEGKYFRIIKARQGTKSIILKAGIHPNTMSTAVLRREYELASTLIHPCIIRTIGFRENTPFGPAIIMEYINGCTLDEFVATGPTIGQKISVLRDILDGMEYLHRRGIIHNDLKPSNIVVNGKGAAHIIDFGLSESEDSLYTGIHGGTQGYSAPETTNGQGSVGVASDIYSVGMLIKLIFGWRKYHHLARKCMSENPSRRPQSVDELKKMMKRSDRLPYLVLGAVVVLAFLTLIFIPGVQNNIAESKETEKIENIRARITAEMEPDYLNALKIMKEQKYKELARTVFNIYLGKATYYLDSVMKCHPMTPDGKPSKEFVIASNNFNTQREVMDSIINSLPDMSELPIIQQEAEYADFERKYLQD